MIPVLYIVLPYYILYDNIPIGFCFLISYSKTVLYIRIIQVRDSKISAQNQLNIQFLTPR